MQSYGAQMRAAMQSLRATDDQFQVFARGVQAVLQQWTALQLVALHCDARAPGVLLEDLCAWYQRDGEVFVDDMEVYFEDFFDNLRGVRIEDDSMKEVATVLHTMYCQCCNNDSSVVDHYLRSLAVYTQTNPVGMSVNAGPVEALAEEDGEEGVDGEEGAEGEAEMGNKEEGEARVAVQVQQGQLQQQQQQQHQPKTQQPKQQKKRKNASVRDKNGWNIVQ